MWGAPVIHFQIFRQRSENKSIARVISFVAPNVACFGGEVSTNYWFQMELYKSKYPVLMNCKKFFKGDESE
jgi:hypothetical protein